MDSRFLRADELGLRLEIVGGIPIWEPSPLYKHQKAVDRIRSSIRKSPAGSQNPCDCVHAADVYISFPDGSLKRPDISIFCREPEEEEEAIRLVPEAVIEVISRGFEAKDLEIGREFYLRQGIKDVIVFNPYTLEVLHARRDRSLVHQSEVALELLCGCTASV